MKGHMVRGLSDISSMSSICDFDIQHDMRLRNEILNVKAKSDNTSPALKFLGVHFLWKCCKDLSRKGNVGCGRRLWLPPPSQTGPPLYYWPGFTPRRPLIGRSLQFSHPTRLPLEERCHRPGLSFPIGSLTQ